MRNLLSSGVVVVTLLTGVAGAQSPWELLGQKGTNGFECAFLAGHAGKALPREGETERLFRYGQEALKAAMQALRMQSGFGEGFGPYFPFLADQSDDFFVGMYAAHASIAIDQLLSEEVPVEPGVETELRMELRGQVALREYSRRNCGIIGR